MPHDILAAISETDSYARIVVDAIFDVFCLYGLEAVHFGSGEAVVEGLVLLVEGGQRPSCLD